MATVGRPSPSLIFVGSGITSTGGSGGSTEGVDAALDAIPGVEAFFLDDEDWGCEGVCGAASETRLFAAGSRRSRAGSLRFSAMATIRERIYRVDRREKACLEALKRWRKECCFEWLSWREVEEERNRQAVELNPLYNHHYCYYHCYNNTTATITIAATAIAGFCPERTIGSFLSVSTALTALLVLAHQVCIPRWLSYTRC